MRFQISKPSIKTNIRDALRKCGYFGLQDRASSQISYVKRLSKSQHYPRFHLYFKETNKVYNFNLHLDQKKESYKGARAHSGEYDEPVVMEEAERLQKFLGAGS